MDAQNNVKDKHLTPVTEAIGTVKPKRTKFQKLCDKVSYNVSNSKLGERVVQEIALPMILDIITTSIAGVFGIESYRARKSVDSVITSVRANTYHTASNGSGYSFVRDDPVVNTPRRSVYDFDTPIVPTKDEAVQMYLSLQACLEQYPSITVADIVQLAKRIPSSSDFDYGWKSLEGVDICHIREGNTEGWILNMPRPMPLD